MARVDDPFNWPAPIATGYRQTFSAAWGGRPVRKAIVVEHVATWVDPVDDDAPPLDQRCTCTLRESLQLAVKEAAEASVLVLGVKGLSVEVLAESGVLADTEFMQKLFGNELHK